ncbi:F0F1 ATP synthase subunit B [Nocardia sp. CDC159]|uniref:ATP synthase subunit b n=1 Tax=Nocardia pulmonis TaxID=2951408 RepID=A0A9X2IY83_9NOCA|nr:MULTISPECIES: F0F1 ATP synthase subunit B [Nocardia]MCM6774715.1 F0F1 ATP synthase subunit B [Nocardia pulmonis]MCM6787220.1 F0F1 ATP synthase subunit B [Nocardia sp. CDC159]
MAAENLAGQNFLIPNGTFLVELAIFLIVLGVIWLFVVPPIREVLAEREERVARTAADGQRARELAAAAADRYRSAVIEARGAAARVREQARSEGRTILMSARERARSEADAMVVAATIELRSHADATAARLRDRIDPLAQELADRVSGGVVVERT